MSWGFSKAQKELLQLLYWRGEVWIPKSSIKRHTAFALRRRGLVEVQEDKDGYSVRLTELARSQEVQREAWEVRFVVPGRPTPKARPRVVRAGGRARAYTPEATKAFEEAVGWEAKRAGARRPVQWPVEVRVKFVVRHRRADLDNLVKAVLDGMRGVVYEDDSQVVRLEAEVLEGREEMTVVEVRRA